MKLFLSLPSFLRSSLLLRSGIARGHISPFALAARDHGKRSYTNTPTRAPDTTDEMGKEKGKDKAEKSSFQLKVPKGTKDWEGKDMVIRDKIFGSITEVFKRHGAVTIDTLVNLSRQYVPSGNR